MLLYGMANKQNPETNVWETEFSQVTAKYFISLNIVRIIDKSAKVKSPKKVFESPESANQGNKVAVTICRSTVYSNLWLVTKCISG